jgi:transposase InsO family protein
MSNGTVRVHRNARLTPAGRRILVERVESGRPIAHVAKEMGVSRTCAHRWVGRFREHGWDGLTDRSSRPRSCPHATAPHVVEAVLSARTKHREGPADLAVRCGVPERTISRIIARAGLPRLWELDPITGERIRAGRATETRYERAAPGDLLHLDVKKLGKIPDGGGWRVHGRSEAVRGRGIGYDYVHVAVDDHSRLAYAEVLPDETGQSCAGFLERAAAFMADNGAPVRRVMTDNAMAYTRSRAFQTALATLGARHVRTKPRHPWQNGKAERFNRTLQEGWAYRRAYTNGQDRTAALPVWLHFYNHQRRHTALGGQPPITRCNQPAG